MGKVVSKVTDAVGLTDTGAAKGYADASAAAMREAAKRLENVNLPDIEKMKLILEAPNLVGELTPEQLGRTELEGISLDPRLREAQMAALNQLTQRGQEGMTEEDRIIFRQFMDQAGAEQKSDLANIQSAMQQRGMADSGTNLAAQLQAQQAGAQAAQQRSAQMAQASIQAKQNALAQAAQAAGQMEQQQFGRQSQVRSAQDVINQFNAANRQNVAAQNLGQRQRIAEQGSALRNQEQMFNKNLEQQQFENEMRKAGGLSQASSNMAQMFAGQAQAQAAANQGAIGGLISGGAALGAAALTPAPVAGVGKAPGGTSDKNAKEDIKMASSKEIKSELNNLLSKLEPYMYKYKNQEKHGQGKRLGIMAQDLEKSQSGKDMVAEDSEGVKNVDVGQVATSALAAAKDLMDRVEKLEKKGKKA